MKTIETLVEDIYDLFRKDKPPISKQDVEKNIDVFVEELNPASYRVDPRNIWPDPACGESIHDGKGIFERQTMTPKQVRELKKQPGYMKEQLRKVLEEGPKHSYAIEEMRDE